MKLIPTAGHHAKQAEALLRKLENRGSADTARVEPIVHRIISDVRRHGDKSLREYAHKLDDLSPQSQLQITRAEMQTALASITPELGSALSTAASNIRANGGRERYAFCHRHNLQDRPSPNETARS